MSSDRLRVLVVGSETAPWVDLAQRSAEETGWLPVVYSSPSLATEELAGKSRVNALAAEVPSAVTNNDARNLLLQAGTLQLPRALVYTSNADCIEMGLIQVRPEDIFIHNVPSRAAEQMEAGFFRWFIDLTPIEQDGSPGSQA